MLFWLYIAGLCVLALAITLSPLLKNRVGDATSSVALSRGYQRAILVALMVLVPALALVLYQQWGDYARVQQASWVQQRMAQVSGEINKTGSREVLIKEFEQHLKQTPQSAKGWYLLGKLYLRDARAEEAVQSLTTANKLKPDDPDTLLALAQALFITKGNALNTESQGLLLQVLEQRPDSPIALTLLGTDAYNKNDYQTALTYFERLLPYYAPDTEEGKRLLEIIAKAQKMRG